MGQGRGRRLCGADRLSARWESTHGVCTESRGFRGGRASDEGESAFDGERPVSRVPSSAHAVRFAPRNRLWRHPAPGAFGERVVVPWLVRNAFRRRWLCVGWRRCLRWRAPREPGAFLGSCCPLRSQKSRCGGTRLPGLSGGRVEVPRLARGASGGDGCTWLGGSAFDGERPGSRVPSSAHAVRCAPRNRAAEAPGSRGFRGVWEVVPWRVRGAFRRRWLRVGWRRCLRWGAPREPGAFLGSCCPLRFQKSPVEAPGSRGFQKEGAFRRRGLSELWGQRNTTVLWPFSMMRCSACHLTARASTTFSTSPPRAVRVSTVMVWSTRSTSCSMMGPSSSSAVT